MWTELIGYLRVHELLPSINFMFSKKMIDQTAQQLQHIDLCTNAEKGRITAFLSRCGASLILQQSPMHLPSSCSLRHFPLRTLDPAPCFSSSFPARVPVLAYLLFAATAPPAALRLQLPDGAGRYLSHRRDIIRTHANSRSMPRAQRTLTRPPPVQAGPCLTHSAQSLAPRGCRSLARISAEDQQLSQIKIVTSQLQRGVGVHHAGLLPILKEAVEMLFCEGLVRVLFATDTFAMGVNAPARAVTFWYLDKPDAVGAAQPGLIQLRPLLPQEYVQMAGRAGRRGIDDFGTVIVIAHEDKLPEQKTLETLMTGKSEKLKSKFRLEYRRAPPSLSHLQQHSERPCWCLPLTDGASAVIVAPLTP